jgi:hypothetical protein
MMIVFLISVMEKKHIALAMQSRYSNFFFVGSYILSSFFSLSLKTNQLTHLNLSSTTLLVFLLSQKEKKEIHTSCQD